MADIDPELVRAILDDETAADWRASADACQRAFTDAVDGVGDIPPYLVTVDPSGVFTVLSDGLEPLDASRVAGDVRRRFIEQVRAPEELDAFAGIRVPWPPSGTYAEADRMYPACPSCRRRITYAGDIAEKYCPHCHWWTLHPELGPHRPDTQTAPSASPEP